MFDGKPFANPAAPPPLFWFREEGKKTVVKPRVDYAAGAFTVRGLSPGRYAMSVRINLEPGNPNIFPGDLTAWEEFTLEAGRTASLEVSLRTVMHLVQPVDNGVVIRGWDVPCGAGNVSPGKLVFSWDALDPGTHYNVSVDRLLCDRGYAIAGRVLTRSTTEAWLKVDLPPEPGGGMLLVQALGEPGRADGRHHDHPRQDGTRLGLPVYRRRPLKREAQRRR